MSRTSEWSSRIISYISRSTNNFSGDLLLLAIASPKLSSTATLPVVTSAKHWSLRCSNPSNIWSQTFLSAANNNLTYYHKIVKCWFFPNLLRLLEKTYSNPHKMNPIPNFKFQNFPLHLLDIIFAKFFHSQLAKTFFQNRRTGIPVAAIYKLKEWEKKATEELRKHCFNRKLMRHVYKNLHNTTMKFNNKNTRNFLYRQQ